MKHIQLFEAYTQGLTGSPARHFILDGASSAGKSSALKGLDSSWGILAVDSFFNVMAEELGIEDFGNDNKPAISQIYPDCPHAHTTPGEESYELAARWYMAQEARAGKIFQAGLKDATGNPFGKPQTIDKIIYDDVDGSVIQMFTRDNRPQWLLVHAPIDHTIKNVERRGDRPLDGVLKNSYTFKYKASTRQGGVDPEHPWTEQGLRDLLPQEEWVSEFLDKLGVKDPSERYWIHAKPQPQGTYDYIINTRDANGAQKSIEELAQEAEGIFNMT
jgi:hypothetical protein